jgi:hypothetical protein
LIKFICFYRYLGMGGNFKAHSMYFLRGASTVAVVVAETAKAVWDCLHSRFMPVPTQQKWREVFQRFVQSCLLGYTAV